MLGFPLKQHGYLYINCLWVSGSMKGHGYSSELLEECLRDAKAQGKNGVCILCAEGRKREFLADPKFLTHKGFKVSDISDCGINLMYLPLAESAQPPKFKACAKHPKVEENGFVLYYTDQCPYTYYWVPKVQEAAKEHGIPFKAIHITEKETAQNVPAPVTTYALFRDGKFVTQRHPVGQEVFEIGRRSGLSDSDETTRIIASQHFNRWHQRWLVYRSRCCCIKMSPLSLRLTR